LCKIARIAKPITKYLEGKKAKYQKIKNVIVQMELVQPDYNKKFALTTDGSDFAIDADVWLLKFFGITYMRFTTSISTQIINIKEPKISKLRDGISSLKVIHPKLIISQDPNKQPKGKYRSV